MTVYRFDATGVTPVTVHTGRQALKAAAAANKVGAVLVAPTGHVINHHQRRKSNS
jgi:hypothetical protein